MFLSTIFVCWQIFPNYLLHIIKHLSVSKAEFFSQWISMTLLVLWQRYLDEAEREKMQYAQELKEYQQTEAYQITSAKIQDKRIKKGDNLCNVCHVGYCSRMHSHHIPRENAKILPVLCFITLCLTSSKKHLQFSLPEDAPSVIISTSSEPSLSKVHDTSCCLTVSASLSFCCFFLFTNVSNSWVFSCCPLGFWPSKQIRHSHLHRGVPRSEQR